MSSIDLLLFLTLIKLKYPTQLTTAGPKITTFYLKIKPTQTWVDQIGSLNARVQGSFGTCASLVSTQFFNFTQVLFHGCLYILYGHVLRQSQHFIIC